MNSKRLEDFETSKFDFETGEIIDEKHYMIIQDLGKNGLYAQINTSTYNSRVREVQKERYAPENKALSKLERAGEDASYKIYILTPLGKHPSFPLSQDMLKKGFPEVFKYFNEPILFS